MTLPTIPSNARVELYESNAGHLLLVAVGVGACEMTHHGGEQSFANDAAGLLGGFWDLSDASPSLVSLYSDKHDIYYAIETPTGPIGVRETTPEDVARSLDWGGELVPVTWDLDNLNLVAVYDPSEAEPLMYYGGMGTAAQSYTGVEVEA